jgi:hypothetical protein
MRKATKAISLALIGGSITFTQGCSSTPDDQHIAAVNQSHVYPSWWWWYMHRPYFDSPMYSDHIVTYFGSGGSYSRSFSGSSYSYSSARSVTGAKFGGGSVKGGSSISARGGFGGGRGAAS